MFDFMQMANSPKSREMLFQIMSHRPGQLLRCKHLFLLNLNFGLDANPWYLLYRCRDSGKSDKGSALAWIDIKR